MKLLGLKPTKKKIIKKPKDGLYCNKNLDMDFNFDKLEADTL
jgi:hypothetical protein